jgi:hypothetical protein
MYTHIHCSLSYFLAEMERTTKQVKIGEMDYQACIDLASGLGMSLRQWMDVVLSEFLVRVESENDVSLFAPKRSDKPRTVWFDANLVERLRGLAASLGVSQNSLIYTALKRSLG